MNIAVFASHNGTDLQAIIDACKQGVIRATVCAVISNNSDSTALVRAEKAGIDNYHISAKIYNDEETLNKEILGILTSHRVDIIFLAGYLKKLGIPVLREYRNRIFNIHPAILPSYGGQGMFGMNVHQAVIHAHEVESGITVHRVTEKYDEGEIVAQTKIPVADTDTAESLAEKILKVEHVFIVEVLNRIISGEISIE